MSVKVFQTNKAGKIEFTRCELEKLLNETYNEGYRDGENHAKSSYWTWTSPSISTHTYPTITYCNSTDPIDNLIMGNTAINGVTSDKTNATTTISTADCSINTDEVKKISGQTPSNDKTFKVDITASVDSPDVKGTQRTCQLDGMTFNLNDLAKTVDAMLSGKVDLFNPTSVKTGKVTVDNPFTNLAKELTTL